MDGLTFITICTLASMGWGAFCAAVDYRAWKKRCAANSLA
jgi:hypothetical protein